MSLTGAYELGRRKGEEHFSILRIYEVGGDPFTGPFEEFLLGEPVYLKGIAVHKAGTALKSAPDQIWWIQEFKEEEGEAFVGVSRSRNKPAEFSFQVTKLEKLPAMVRLAVEYAV